MSSPTPVPERTEEHSNTAPARPRCSTDSIVCHPNGIVERVFRVEGNSKGSAFEDDDPVDVDFCCDTDLESVSTSSARPDPEPADEQDLTCKYRYLSLTCGKKPGSPYECDPSKGKDTWVVVMDSGFEPDAFPHASDPFQRTTAVPSRKSKCGSNVIHKQRSSTLMSAPFESTGRPQRSSTASIAGTTNPSSAATMTARTAAQFKARTIARLWSATEQL